MNQDLKLALLCLLPAAAITILLGWFNAQHSEVFPVANAATSETGLSKPDLNKPLGFSVSGGAAAGYIEDQACASCHAGHAESYQHVGMSKSFARPRAEKFIENFSAAPYFHERSGRYYQVSRNGDELFFKRYQLDDQGQPINMFEQKIDWIVGSGNKTRSYLYQTDSGELFQLPIGWYSQTQDWRMAPGYDKKNHLGVLRRVRRECMFCHNAYPDVATGSDDYYQPHLFPSELPEGTGCQRCHGPGADHVRTVLSGKASLEEMRAAITNPAKLPTQQRDSVCFQCHMLPAVALIGVRRFGRSDYSFRPGEKINDYLLHVDITEEERSQTDRFEINHHAYRLQQSACFQKSAGELTCISCHNPHRKVPPEQRITHYSAVCANCHQAHEPKPGPITAAADDCVSCHMPQRRTQDVVHVVMTDHKIQREPGGEERLALREEAEHSIESVEFLLPQQAPNGALGDIYKLVTLMRAKATPDFTARLEALLAKTPEAGDRPYFDLALAQIKLKRYAQAEQTLLPLLEKHPGHQQLLQWLGTAYLAQNKTEASEQVFRRILNNNPEAADAWFNLALALLKSDRQADALHSIQQALSLRPNLAIGWYYLGQIHATENHLAEATKAFQQALKIEPTHTRAYLELANTLLKQGDNKAAERYLRHAKRYARNPSVADKAILELESEKEPDEKP